MYKYILFDLDGTLTDPGMGITNSVMYSLKKMNIVPPERSELFKFIGPPLRDSYMNYYGMTEGEAAQATAYYREYYSVTGLFENELYPGIAKLLDKLKKDGYICMLATSKPEEFSIKILKRFEIYEYFDFIAAATMDGSRATKSDVIRYGLSMMNITDPTEALMIGDRFYDVEGSRELGIECIGVTYGYGDRAEHEEHNAAFIADTTDEIYEIITSHK